VYLAVPEPVPGIEHVRGAGNQDPHSAAAGAEESAPRQYAEDPAAAGTGRQVGEKIMGGWFMYGEVSEDAGEVGGDEQIGRASSIQFANLDMPGRLITVHVYPVARELDHAEMPECSHGEPEGWACKHGRPELHKPGGSTRCICYLPPEHMRCSWDMDSVGLQMMTEFMICEDINEPGGTESWSDHRYDDVDAMPLTGAVGEILAKAESVALGAVRRFNGERDINWDGKQF
jgi:hypothetical protein